jgi:glutathione synthase/RimK-type ligase-like ATP-grasp enzyme
MKRYAIIIEYAKGSDKGCDGFRPDTKPILNSLKKVAEIEGEVVFYNPKRKDELFDYIKKRATIVISRINPGNLKEVDEYFVFLKKLSDKGIDIHTHPDVMINLDFKDILEKLKNSLVGDKGTFFYHTFKEFKKDFPSVLEKYRIRVLKTNYGSTGEGVYLVSLRDDDSIICTEAVDNVKYFYENMEEFLKGFKSKFDHDDSSEVYFKGKSGFVGCRYLPRINEGEIRALLVNDKIVSIVHKKPQNGEFSATLFSGAKYEYNKPNDPKYKDVIDLTKKALKDIKKHLNGQNYPLLWTMDYILDYDKKGKDNYVLSEINCSCVGITTQLELADEVAKVFVK